MIITVEELREFIDTEMPDTVLQFRIEALEAAIIKYTNNTFTDGYPSDVKMGVIEILQWKFRNEEKNGTDTSKKDIQSETLSRHSVTYAQDATESDIDETFGVPKKYTAFLKHYVKGRF